MNRPRTSGLGRRFELVLMRLRPPTPRTVALIAKHASERSYHWVLMSDRTHAREDVLARLLAVAYLDEASGLLGRGDPLWSLPRAYLRVTGELETHEEPGKERGRLRAEVRAELRRIALWLRTRHPAYLESLGRALREAPERPDGFRPLSPEEARRRGFSDPLERSLLAPPPPPVVTRTPRPGAGEPSGARWPWRAVGSYPEG